MPQRACRHKGLGASLEESWQNKRRQIPWVSFAEKESVFQSKSVCDALGSARVSVFVAAGQTLACMLCSCLDNSSRNSGLRRADQLLSHLGRRMHVIY